MLNQILTLQKKAHPTEFLIFNRINNRLELVVLDKFPGRMYIVSKIVIFVYFLPISRC